METNFKDQIQALGRSLELAPNEIKKDVLGSDEKKLSIAITQHRIISCDIEDVKKALRYAMVKVGLRASNWPEDEEKAVLFQHVITEYGNHTPDEIRLAFDMAIAGKLTIDRKEVICYENFSCLYFSGIMNAYRTWSEQAYRHVVKELPPPPKWSKQEIAFEWGMYLALLLKKKTYLPPLK